MADREAVTFQCAASSGFFSRLPDFNVLSHHIIGGLVNPLLMPLSLWVYSIEGG
jgi:hypothetical protein